MPEDYYTTAPKALPRSGPSLRGMLLAGLISFLGGAGLLGWLVWQGKIDLAPPRPAPAASGTQQVVASPTPAPSLSTVEMDQQVAALERRLAQLNLQTAALGGNSARAEALLVAGAARRAIEQGKPLDYLEAQLRTRFGTARPAAVNTIVAAAKAPVTLDQLAAQLDGLSPALLDRPKDEDGWSRFTRELSGLFVIRRDDGKTSTPDQRLDHAKLLLRSGQIDAAAAEVLKLPASQQARDWLAAAKRYADAQAALDQIEQAALTEPELLKDGNGEAVRQPGMQAPTPAG
ncbi:MAG: hypothetical protein ACKOOL_04700 [Novosphingobium sp.]